jgi:SAM-dependent methyltransferase
MTSNFNDVRSQAEHAWGQTVAGEYAQENTQRLYDEAVYDLFGFYALQMGNIETDLLRNSRIPNLYIASDSVSESKNQDYMDLKCEDDFLPFSEMSLDLLLLPHRLEFSERPHQTLREAERVIMPEGHLIISGYNPISAWGIKFLFKKLVHRVFFKKRGQYPEKMYPWHAQLITLARLKDWLALLDFEVITIKKTCHIPPFNSEKLHSRFVFMDKLCKKSLGYLGCNRFGGVYFVVAKKRVPGVTPLKPKWKAPKMPKVLIPRPSSRQTNPNKQTINEFSGEDMRLSDSTHHLK